LQASRRGLKPRREAGFGARDPRGSSKRGPHLACSGIECPAGRGPGLPGAPGLLAVDVSRDETPFCGGRPT
jgi:hypothetical protein